MPWQAALILFHIKKPESSSWQWWNDAVWADIWIRRREVRHLLHFPSGVGSAFPNTAGERGAKAPNMSKRLPRSLTNSLDLNKWQKMVAPVVSAWFDIWTSVLMWQREPAPDDQSLGPSRNPHVAGKNLGNSSSFIPPWILRSFYTHLCFGTPKAALSTERWSPQARLDHDKRPSPAAAAAAAARRASVRQFRAWRLWV